MPSNLQRKADRSRKQTRLTFDPIDPSANSSSSTGNGLSPAKIRYEMPKKSGMRNSSSPYFEKTQLQEDSEDELSSIKKRNMFRDVGNTPTKKQGKLQLKALPTPGRSSQTQVKDTIDLTGEDDNMSLRRSTRNASASNTPQNRTSIAPKSSGTRSKERFVELSGDSEEEISLPNSKSKKKPSIFGNASTQRRLSPRAAGSTKLSEAFEDSENDSDDFVVASSSRRRSKAALREEDSDSEEPISSPAKRRKSKPIIVDEEDEDDDEPIVSPIKRSSPLKRQRQPIETDESEVESPSKRQRPVGKNATETDESDFEFESPPKRRNEDDSVLQSPGNIKGKGHIGLSEGRKSTKTPTRLTRQQNQPKKHRTAKEKQLELLKRKRAGNVNATLTDSDIDDDEHPVGLYDSGSDLQALSEFEDESEEEVVEKRKKMTTPRKKTKSVENGDDYDSEFVVEDDDELLGVPMLDIPLAFTQAAHKPIKEHFKDAIEWLVHNKLNPGFSRDDAVYRTAWRKLEDESRVIASSKFISSQWTEEFTKAIYARPDMHERKLAPGEGLDLRGEVRCEACNRSKHPATWGIMFRGTPYSKETLEPIEDDSDEKSDKDSSDDSDATLNSKGEPVPDADYEYFVGVTCRNNASQGHTLIHWKHSLHEWVVGSLQDRGYMSPEKLAAKEKLTAKKKTAFVNSIVDDWETQGTIKELFRLWKDQLETAKTAEQSSRGWGRSR